MHPNSFCYLIQNNAPVAANLHENQLVLASKDGHKSSKHPKVLLTFTKDLLFSITKTQILENKKYKFSLQLKIKSKETKNLIIDEKENLEFFIKHLSLLGMATGLQEMAVSCEKIGEGTFAEVYKVITNYDSVMALKSFNKKSIKIHKNKLAFHNQIDVMRSLESKHIATVEGIFETQKNIYLKMQYFSFSLKHYIKKNISIKTQKRIMKQLFEALVVMKQKNIIHRDLKPENVMIRGKNQQTMECVIIDFGLATPANVDKYIYNRCGTPGFLAPEVAKLTNRKDKLTPACDIFSLGCIFYRILTKKYIFSAANYNQVIEKNKNVDIPWENFSQFSENQTNLLEKMLDKDPITRITPEVALKHPYFIEEVDDEDEIPAQGCDLMRKMKSITSTLLLSRKPSTESMMSSFYSNTNSNGELTENEFVTLEANKQKFEIKDSCLSFQGPIKGSESDSKDGDFVTREQTHKTSRLLKRASRFSQINQVVVL